MNNEIEDKRAEIDKLFKQIDFKSHLPAHLKAEIEFETIYTDFVLNFLIRKSNMIGEIDSLLLKMNGSKKGYYHFLKHFRAAEYGYVEILQRKEESIKLRLTEKGISHYEYISKKYRVRTPFFLLRPFLFTKKMLKKVIAFIAYDIPHYLKVFSESGIVKFTLFIIAVLTFVLKWKEIKEFIHIWTK